MTSDLTTPSGASAPAAAPLGGAVPGAAAGLSAGTAIRRTVLDGGLRVLTEAMPSTRSVSLGLWVGLGSRDETPALAGATHFLEHLLFKGTKRRTAFDISASLEAVGGDLNAFTTREYTCYHARVLDRDLALAVDVLADMITSSVVRAADVDLERTVVLDEIAMHEEEMADVAHEAFLGEVLAGHPLAAPVLGTVDSITAMTRDRVAGYYKRRYTPPRIVVTAAGAVDHDTVVDLVRRAIEVSGRELDATAEPAPRRVGGHTPAYRPSTRLVRRQTEQAHVLLGGPGLIRGDERRFAFGVLSAVLGGGMASRLFQEVREERGLAYSTYSFGSSYADAGVWGVYAGCLPTRVEEVLDVLRTEVATIAADGITQAELDRGRGQLSGGVVLGMEDSSSRMTRLGKSELVAGEILDIDEILDRVAGVTADDVASLAADLMAEPTTQVVVGPFEDDTAWATTAG